MEQNQISKGLLRIHLYRAFAVKRNCLITRLPDSATAPPGFRYQPEFVSDAEERELAAALATLPFKPFEFHGHVGNRRVVSFGLRYDHTRREVQRAEDPPAFLDNLRRKVAQLTGYEAQNFSRSVSMNIPPVPESGGTATSRRLATSLVFHFCLPSRRAFGSGRTRAECAGRSCGNRAPSTYSAEKLVNGGSTASRRSHRCAIR